MNINNSLFPFLVADIGGTNARFGLVTDFVEESGISTDDK